MLQYFTKSVIGYRHFRDSVAVYLHLSDRSSDRSSPGPLGSTSEGWR